MMATADYGYSNAVDLYNSASGIWSTAQLSLARHFLCATSVGNVAIFGGGRVENRNPSNVYEMSPSTSAVDLYNSASFTWSTGNLSVARFLLAATSVGNVAIFAGGTTGISSFALCVEVLLLGLLCVGEVWLRRVA